MQRVTEFFLECAGVERPGFMWPVGKWVVDVGEHGERVGIPDEAGYLCQVLPDDPGCGPLLRIWLLCPRQGPPTRADAEIEVSAGKQSLRSPSVLGAAAVTFR
jgi:hypothetical protein